MTIKCTKCQPAVKGRSPLLIRTENKNMMECISHLSGADVEPCAGSQTPLLMNAKRKKN
jgi:hypothetical protein